MEWMTMPLRRYAEFSGRSRRKEYWMFTLLLIIVNVVVGILELSLGLAGTMGYGPLSLVVLLAVIVPSIAVSVRRLHDTGRSGWLQLIGLIPVVGWIVLIVFYAQDSKPGANEHGPNPKEGAAVGYAAPPVA